MLLEHSLFPFEPSKLDGLSNDDEIVNDKGRVFELLELLKASKVNNSVSIPSADSLFAEAYLHRHNTGNIPLTFIYQNYHRIRQSARSENLLRIAADGIGIEDVPGRTASPYNQHQLFAFAPFADTIVQFNNIRFSLPQVLWQMAGISSVQLDFNDGRGFRTLRPGNTVSIYYESEGLKTISARITVGGSTRRAKAQFYYRRPKTFVQPDYQLNITAQPVYTSESQYLGGSAHRNASVSCSEGTAWERINCRLELGARIEVENGCDNVFDKPVIIVEGFDPTGSLTTERLRDRFDNFNFLSTLKAAGYDIVYVIFLKTLIL